jgi:hypothetical protein
MVEVLNTVARLSRLNAESSLSEARYDLSDGALHTQLHASGEPHEHSPAPGRN